MVETPKTHRTEFNEYQRKEDLGEFLANLDMLANKFKRTREFFKNIEKNTNKIMKWIDDKTGEIYENIYGVEGQLRGYRLTDKHSKLIEEYIQD